MFEVLNFYLPKIIASDVLKRERLEPNKYFVVSAHREENINNVKKFATLIDSLNKIASEFSMPIIVSTHPRTAKMIEDKKLEVDERVKFLKPLGFSDYNFLQMNASAVLSDSGTISEESSILNFRAVNIREAHERPEAMEETSVMMAGLTSERIIQCLYQLKDQHVGNERNFLLVSDYNIPNVSDKIVRIILSYTDYVKRVVWKEY
jgi:UDP-N-acetylglucosamine 2-epimerase (non-hydrolysing)